MTDGSEGQGDQVRISPLRSSIGREHRFAAPVPQRGVLVEQQRVGSEELFEVNDLRPVGHSVGDQAHPEPGHGVVVRGPMAVVMGKPLDAFCYDLFGGTSFGAVD